jgi:putative membrane protein
MKKTFYEDFPIILFTAWFVILLVGCSSTLTYQEAVNDNRKNLGTQKQQADAEFLVDAQSFNLLEKELNQLAIRNGYSADLVKFARANQKAHKKLEAELEKLANAEKIKLPVTMKSEHANIIQELVAVERTDFDRRFVEVLREVNSDNERMYEASATDANDADIRGFAARKLGLYRSNRDALAAVDEGLLQTQR